MLTGTGFLRGTTAAFDAYTAPGVTTSAVAVISETELRVVGQRRPIGGDGSAKRVGVHARNGTGAVCDGVLCDAEAA